MSKINISVLISGRGSNLAAIIEACKQGDLPVRIVRVISNNPDAKGLLLAQKEGIRTDVVNHKDYSNRKLFEEALLKVLAEDNLDLICLAGFMRILSEHFLINVNCKVINIHPSLLPAFKGANAVKDAFDYGVKIMGCTVHYVNSEVDSGEIIDQESIKRLESDNLDSIKQKILEKEHIIFVNAIRNIAKISG